MNISPVIKSGAIMGATGLALGTVAHFVERDKLNAPVAIGLTTATVLGGVLAGATFAPSAILHPAGMGAIALGILGGAATGYFATQLGASLLDKG